MSLEVRAGVRHDRTMPEAATLLPERFVVPLDGSDFALRAVRFADVWAVELGSEIEFVTTPQTAEREARTTAPCWLMQAAHGLKTSKVCTRYIDIDDPVAAILDTTHERPQTWLAWRPMVEAPCSVPPSVTSRNRLSAESRSPRC